MLATALAFFVSGCGGSAHVPDRLLDDTRARRPPVPLHGVTLPAILTRVRRHALADAEPGSASATCLARNAGTEPAGVAVERVGALGESVTFSNASHDVLLACDNSAGQREDDRRWCGGAAGELRRGHLLDPRLDIGCGTADGAPLAFVWVEPVPRTRFVAVDQGAYSEVYEVVHGFPVRIATSREVDANGASAAFELAEYDATGRLVRRYALEARVAG